MKIKKLKINSFGNLENKEIDLSDNINIIYGRNEAGKSTLLKFITNIFYGTSRTKKGQDFSDYDRYKPWGKEDFSGKIKYELDNGEVYEVYREFGKKNTKIFNSNFEDISKNFDIDKNLGNQFFYEQTKVDEQTFLSTVAAMQQELKLEKNSQNNLIQKMANIAGTGEDNVSYQKAIDKLNKKQLEEVGTYRTQGKPVNIVQSRLNMLKMKKNELLSYTDKKYDFEQNRENIDEQIKNDELKILLLKKLKEINDQQESEEEKLNYNVNSIEEKNAEIKNLKNEKNKILKNNDFESEDELINVINRYEDSVKKIREGKYFENRQDFKDSKKLNIKKYIILIVIAVIINLLLFIFAKNGMKFIGMLFFPMIILMYYIEKNKLKKNRIIQKNKSEMNKRVEENRLFIALDKSKELLNTINSKNAQIEILEKNKNDEIERLEEIENRIRTLADIEKEKVKNTYRDEMDIYEINRLFNSEDIEKELEDLQNRTNDRKLELHKIDLSKENIIPKLDDLAKVEEEILVLEEEYEDLMKRNNAILIAKKALEKAYEKMKSTVTPKFTNSLSKNISDISNGKYNKVSINDENGLMVELPSGEYVSADRLSLGTIDQLYLALRISMCTDISNENMPLILDEAFAFYDDERLENIFRFFIENYYDKQIIILTCTRREEEILNRLKVEFNKVVL